MYVALVHSFKLLYLLFVDYCFILIITTITTVYPFSFGKLFRLFPIVLLFYTML